MMIMIMMVMVMVTMVIISNYEVFLTTPCGTGGFVKTIPSALTAPFCVQDDNGYKADDGDDTFKCFVNTSKISIF